MKPDKKTHKTMKHLLITITILASFGITRTDTIRHTNIPADIRQTNSIRDTIPTIGDKKVKHSLTNVRKAISKKSHARIRR